MEIKMRAQELVNADLNRAELIKAIWAAQAADMKEELAALKLAADMTGRDHLFDAALRSN